MAGRKPPGPASGPSHIGPGQDGYMQWVFKQILSKALEFVGTASLNFAHYNKYTVEVNEVFLFIESIKIVKYTFSKRFWFIKELICLLSDVICTVDLEDLVGRPLLNICREFSLYKVPLKL